MTEKKQFAVRMPPDMAETVENYAEENNISHADALRRACNSYFMETDDKVLEELGSVKRQITGALAGIFYLGATIIFQPAFTYTPFYLVWIALGLGVLLATIATIYR